MNTTNGNAQAVGLLKNIPPELCNQPLWVQYYLVQNGDKKPTKHPCVAYTQRENCRTLDHLLKRKSQAGFQRIVEKDEGLVFIDLDHCRKADSGAIEQWAQDIIDSVDSYTEISPSGTGFHIVCKAKLTDDFKVDGNPIEIFSAARIQNKLIAMTGNVIDVFHGAVEERQQQAEQILKQCKNGKAQSVEELKPKQDSERLLADYEKARAAGLSPEALQKMEAEIMQNDEPAKPTEEKRWRDVFHTVSELEQAPSKVFIKGILEEGVTFFGAHSGVGKTWLGLSISRALLSGEPLFGKFPVLQKANVLYLVPEMGGSKFRERTEKLHISKDGGFFCQTIRDGACNLEDPLLLQAIAMTKATVILDTAIRFQAGDEQSSTQQAQGLGANMFNLIKHGAAAVICMHHRSKDLQDKAPTLENTLRGTGDFGAMADCVWCVEYASKRGNTAFLDESKQLVRIALTCVKPRDMEPADPFVLQGRPHINESGDFRVICDDAENLPEEHASAGTEGDEKVIELRKGNPNISQQEIRRLTGFGFDRIKRILGEMKNGSAAEKKSELF